MIDLAVIGGGPAGMMAAGFAAMNGLDVLLLEKNNRPGKKLLITGKGRCNMTNACTVKEMIANIPGNGKFLTNVLYRFDSGQLIDFFESRGVPTKIERGARVFPQSDSSGDVLACLQSFMADAGVKMMHRRVRGIKKEDGIFCLRLGRDKYIYSSKVILAAGGRSYPATGSTGDGYALAEYLGHGIVRPRPALVPMRVDFGDIPDLQGLSLRNVGFSVLEDGQKVVFNAVGEMLFTHFGISGPVPLSASLHFEPDKEYSLSVDMKPGLDHAKLSRRLERDFSADGRKKIKTVLSGLLPDRLVPAIFASCLVDPEKQAAQASKKDVRELTNVLKDLRLQFAGFRSFKEAIITAGGVNVSEIDPRSLQSRLVDGFYFAGEIIDVHGYTGGFNLHIAFATGFVSGNSCSSTGSC